MSLQDDLNQVLSEMETLSPEELRAELDLHSKGEFAVAFNEARKFIEGLTMKIEGYLYIPFQGQFRFLYDENLDSINRIYQSDPAYDAKLGVHELTGNRPATCRELVWGSFHRDEWEPIIRALIQSKVREQLLRATRTTVVKMEIEGRMVGKNPVWIAFICTSR